MKIAVINFSGNVGKTTIARHLLLPRIEGAELFSVESLNAADGEGHAMRGRQFGELQELLQTMDSAGPQGSPLSQGGTTAPKRAARKSTSRRMASGWCRRDRYTACMPRTSGSWSGSSRISSPRFRCSDTK
jgi:hypothetical protein